MLFSSITPDDPLVQQVTIPQALPDPTLLASTNAVLSSGQARLELPGVARVDLLENDQRPAMTWSISSVSDAEERYYFERFLSQSNLPDVDSATQIVVSAQQAVTGQIGLRVVVPQSLHSLDVALVHELYAIVPVDTPEESMGEYEPLNAEYNAETGELSAPLPGSLLRETTNGSALIAAAQSFSVTITVAVRFGATTQPRNLPVDADVMSPSAGETLVGARDHLPIEADLTFKVPAPLVNPVGPGTMPRLSRGFSSTHNGLDLIAPDNTPVYAAADGVVQAPFFQTLPGTPNCNPNVQRGGGWTIRILDDDGTVSGYAHLVQGSELVRAGQHVTAGTKIALADHTGGTCPSGPGGAHLHFGYRVGGAFIDSLPYINATRSEMEEKFLNSISVEAVLDGTPIDSTRQSVDSASFHYSSELDLSALDLEPGRSYPFSLRIVWDDNQSLDFFNATLRVRTTGLRVVLTWDHADTDVDLHVRDTQGNEAWFGNLTGIPGAFLDHDDTDGFGPEVFTMETLAPNATYRVFLHYYSDHGNGATTAQVVVYEDNIPVTQFSQSLSDGQYVDIGVYPIAQGGTWAPGLTSVPKHLLTRPTSNPKVRIYSLPGPNVRNAYLIRK